MPNSNYAPIFFSQNKVDPQSHSWSASNFSNFLGLLASVASIFTKLDDFCSGFASVGNISKRKGTRKGGAALIDDEPQASENVNIHFPNSNVH